MTYEQVEKTINELEAFPLSENAQHLVNYLRRNIDDVNDTFADLSEPC